MYVDSCLRRDPYPVILVLETEIHSVMSVKSKPLTLFTCMSLISVFWLLFFGKELSAPLLGCTAETFYLSCRAVLIDHRPLAVGRFDTFIIIAPYIFRYFHLLSFL